MPVDATSLAGKVAVVAGGARGIGRACALRLADLGARVAVLDVSLQGAATFGEQLTAASVEDELRARSGDGLGLEVDLAQTAATERAVGTVAERWGRVDIVVISAGGAVTPMARSTASKLTDEDLDLLLDINLRTVITTCRASIPHLRAAGGGAVVTMASTAALAAGPGGFVAAYGAAKAAVLQYTRYLAAEVGKDNIRVNWFAPGVIRTSRVLASTGDTGFIQDGKDAGIPLGRQGEPDDIADAVHYLVTPLSAYVTGQVIPVNGGALMY